MLDDYGVKYPRMLACCLQVREALTKKVSRERVGQELDGMFNGMQNGAYPAPHMHT